jgi:transposase
VRQGTTIIRQRQADDLKAWLQTCRANPSVEFSTLLMYSSGTMRPSKPPCRSPWSNGLIEGHINRLKRIKRSRYGRMQWDLLQQRVLYDAA